MNMSGTNFQATKDASGQRDENLDVVLVIFRNQAAGDCGELRNLVILFEEKDININTILQYMAKGVLLLNWERVGNLSTPSPSFT
jgi:hypothetical protein